MCHGLAHASTTWLCRWHAGTGTTLHGYTIAIILQVAAIETQVSKTTTTTSTTTVPQQAEIHHLAQGQQGRDEGQRQQRQVAAAAAAVVGGSQGRNPLHRTNQTHTKQSDHLVGRPNSCTSDIVFCIYEI